MMGQKISGSVQDENVRPFGANTVSLINDNDSSIIKFGATGASGQFRFAGIAAGNYLLQITHVGNQPLLLPLQVSGQDQQLPSYRMVRSTTNLGEVMVTAKKNIVEIKADKTVLNVDGIINAVGSDALALLRKSPGVMVDKDDNLSLSGKTGVQVFIDGRPTPLAGKDLADFLKSMQSSNVEAIEIITNPSAKYEAAGNPGIINIRLKKNKAFGTNGSVNAGWAIGTYPKYNAGASLNNRSRKTNIFGTYNYNHNKNKHFMNLYRNVADSIFDQRNNMLMMGDNHTYKVGMDYYVSKKSTLGVIFNGSVSDSEIQNDSRTPIMYAPTKAVSRYLLANNSNKMSRNNFNANANYRPIDTSGHELNLDADYARYDINSNQLQPNVYYDASGNNELSRIVYNMLSPTMINLYSLKADHEQNYKKGRLGLGAKISFVNTDNDFQRYNVYSNSKVLDTLRSNRFNYRENIHAVYANYNRKFTTVMLQAGLRVENTHLTGTSTGMRLAGGNYLAYDSSFTRDCTDFFPSIAVTFTKNPLSQWGLTYSRRIDRPAYQDLNPFEFKLDEYSFMRGNTNLRPQYTNSFGITHAYQYKLNSRLNYSHVQDIFTQLIDTAEISKTFISRQNLATQDIASLNVSYPFSYKNFTAFVNLNSSYSAYKANFGPDQKVNLDVFSYNVYLQNSLKIGKTITAELSGFYTSPGIWQRTFESKGMGGKDMRLQKIIFKGKGNVKASVSDVLKTMRWSGLSHFAGQVTRASGNRECRHFKLNSSHRFGNSQVKAVRQRKTALEDESKRRQGGGFGAQ